MRMPTWAITVAAWSGARTTRNATETLPRERRGSRGAVANAEIHAPVRLLRSWHSPLKRQLCRVCTRARELAFTPTNRAPFLAAVPPPMEIIASLEALERATSKASEAQGIMIPPIRSIVFGSKKIGDVGAKTLATTLERIMCLWLEKIDLYGNVIGDEGIEALAKALQRGWFPNLKEINLGNNVIGPNGAKAVARA